MCVVSLMDKSSENQIQSFQNQNKYQIPYQELLSAS